MGYGQLSRTKILISRALFANSEDPDEMQHNSIMLHFIRVYTVCKGEKIFRQKNAIFFESYNLTHWAIPSLLCQTRRKNPLVYKGKHSHYTVALDEINISSGSQNIELSRD